MVNSQLLPTVKPQVRAHMPPTANEPQTCGTDSAPIVLVPSRSPRPDCECSGCGARTQAHRELCPGRFLQPRDTIVYMSVYDEMPSPGAGLLRYARLKAGLSQSELGKRAGVARTMVSAYEHDDVLRELEQHRSPEERQAWEDYQGARVAKDRAAVSAALRARKTTKVPV